MVVGVSVTVTGNVTVCTGPWPPPVEMVIEQVPACGGVASVTANDFGAVLRAAMPAVGPQLLTVNELMPSSEILTIAPDPSDENASEVIGASGVPVVSVIGPLFVN